MTAIRNPYRRKPIANVVRDLQAVPQGWNWLQRKYLMLWDNNLGADREYFRDLCEAITPLKRIWATETSIDTVTAESGRTMGKAGCRFVYVGLESLSMESLRTSNKLHNQVAQYKQRIRYLHDNGVLIMSIFLVGLDGDTPQYLEDLPNLAHDIGVDVPVFSLAAPILGTPFHQDIRDSGRLLPGNILGGLDGMHLVYEPLGLSPDELEFALFRCMKRAYSSRRIAERILRRVGKDPWTSLANMTANLAFISYQCSLARVGLERVQARGKWPNSFKIKSTGPRPFSTDWENLIGPDGSPTQPESGIAVGFSVRTTDPVLLQLLQISWGGPPLGQTWGWGVTFVIEPLS